MELFNTNTFQIKCSTLINRSLYKLKICDDFDQTLSYHGSIMFYYGAYEIL